MAAIGPTTAPAIQACDAEDDKEAESGWMVGGRALEEVEVDATALENVDRILEIKDVVGGTDFEMVEPGLGVLDVVDTASKVTIVSMLDATVE